MDGWSECLLSFCCCCPSGEEEDDDDDGVTMTPAAAAAARLTGTGSWKKFRVKGEKETRPGLGGMTAVGDDAEDDDDDASPSLSLLLRSIIVSFLSSSSSSGFALCSCSVVGVVIPNFCLWKSSSVAFLIRSGSLRLRGSLRHSQG